MADINYRLLERNPRARNGYSVFERVFWGKELPLVLRLCCTMLASRSNREEL